MIRHNLKLAWRQLKKYRLQSLVSIVSLAVGFACFALAMLWIRYERTYDAFHKDADRIHVILKDRNMFVNEQIGMQSLQELPQFDKLTRIFNINHDSVNGLRIKDVSLFEYALCDTNFLSLFNVELLQGSLSFIHNTSEVAVSDKLAHHLWGDESPIGKELIVSKSLTRFFPQLKTRTVVAVFKDWGTHTNIPFCILSRLPEELPKKFYGASHIMARIPDGVDVDALNAHLDTMMVLDRDMSRWGEIELGLNEHIFKNKKLKAVPITQVRHATESYERYAKAKLNHIYLFAIAGGLLITCGLLNYLTMFVNRLFIRKREIALRTVLGASGWRLMGQFLTEYCLLLLFVIVVGWFAMEFSLADFRTMADLPKDTGYIYRECFLYMVFVVFLSLLLSVPAIWYFRRQLLRSSITGQGGLSRYNLFRRISTGGQMAISIFCIFCTMVLLKQLDTLRHGDIGFERENRMCYSLYNQTEDECESLLAFLRQQPEVEKVLITTQPIYPVSYTSNRKLNPHNDSQIKKYMVVYKQNFSEAMVHFYGMTLLQGRWLHDGEENAIMVNETLARIMEWREPIGQTFLKKMVVGVVKDFMNESPTAKAKPYILQDEITEERESLSKFKKTKQLLLHYKPDTRKQLMKKIEDFFKEQDRPYREGYWRVLSDTYNIMLRSEDNLQKLLTITTGACILIALFGVWSMIMLTCEQRRKEIAIRRIHGATVGEILKMFFSEYLLLQAVAAVIVFPIGYACMKPWLENYVVQTSISWWIYVGIFFVMFLLVALCIGWRVWKTANAHPAEEISKG